MCQPYTSLTSSITISSPVSSSVLVYFIHTDNHWCIDTCFLVVLLHTATIAEAFSASHFRHWRMVRVLYLVCLLLATLVRTFIPGVFLGLASKPHTCLSHVDSTMSTSPLTALTASPSLSMVLPSIRHHHHNTSSTRLVWLLLFSDLDSFHRPQLSFARLSTTTVHPCTRLPQHRHKELSSTSASRRFLLQVVASALRQRHDYGGF
jgi:hypothetical protein